MQKLYLYSRFERFWHWSQAVLVILLILSGFEIHGTWSIWGFEKAHDLHVISAWGLTTLVAYAIFWHFTTGEWRQYLPTSEKLKEMATYYTSGIFSGAPHPFEKSREKKLNPLQRWAYFMLKVILFPVQFISGFLLLYYNDWKTLGIRLDLEPLALLHTLGSFAFLAFLIIHVYLTTTGRTFFSHIKAMITGWESTGG
jgi:thiosulfate reductase cytochrome b subunit